MNTNTNTNDVKRFKFGIFELSYTQYNLFYLKDEPHVLRPAFSDVPSEYSSNEFNNCNVLRVHSSI